MIPYNRQSISNSDIELIKKTLKKTIITRGDNLVKFEKAIKNYVSCKYTLGFNSASSALTSACFGLNISKNDIVWTAPNSFVASANCALHFGARIDFVDIDKDYKNIDIDYLEQKLTKAKKINKLPKLLISVHFGGQATYQEKIYRLSKKFGFKILEDASHSLGAKRFNQFVGSSKWSDATVFSFHPIKTITSAEGGMVCTNDYSIYEKIKLFRNNGITKNHSEFIKKNEGDWHYEQICLGHNYHLNEIECALGLSQVSQINSFVKKRNSIANFYDKNIHDCGFKLPKIEKENLSSYHLYAINIDTNKIDKTFFFKYMLKKGINLNVHYIPIHLHPFYKKLNFKKGDFPNSEWHYDTSISLPMYVGLKKDEQKKIINLIKKFVE